MSDAIPLHVHNDEAILRAIKAPSHVKAQRDGSFQLKPAAFKSRAGSDDVSVMRLDYLGFQRCRERARTMPAYIGVAVLRVGVVRDCRSDVVDSRDLFLGHAHITHGVVLPPDEPLDAAISEELTERIKAMIKHVKFERDPAPTSEVWEGPAMTA